MLLELGIASEAKNTETKPNHVMIEPHNKYTRLRNSVTTSRHDKSTKKNVTTSIIIKLHHIMKSLNNVMIKTHHIRPALQDILEKPHNIMK